jgi:hypothetical protein
VVVGAGVLETVDETVADVTAEVVAALAVDGVVWGVGEAVACGAGEASGALVVGVVVVAVFCLATGAGRGAGCGWGCGPWSLAARAGTLRAPRHTAHVMGKTLKSLVIAYGLAIVNRAWPSIFPYRASTSGPTPGQTYHL